MPIPPNALITSSTHPNGVPPGSIFGTLPPIPIGHVISGPPNHYGYALPGQFSAGPAWYQTGYNLTWVKAQTAGITASICNNNSPRAVTLAYPNQTWTNGNGIVFGNPTVPSPFQFVSSFPNSPPNPYQPFHYAPTEPKPDPEVAKLKEQVAELESDNRAAVRELASVNEALIKLRNEMEEIKAYLSQGPDTQRSNQKTDYWR